MELFREQDYARDPRRLGNVNDLLAGVRANKRQGSYAPAIVFGARTNARAVSGPTIIHCRVVNAVSTTR
jgi:hypothetical protein